MKMWLRLAVILTFICCHSTKAEHFMQKFGPCNFYDSINITSGHLDQYENFHHNDVVYKKGTFKEYDYVIVNFTTLVKVEPHVRGCVCMYKPCIRLCRICEDEESENCMRTSTFSVPTDSEEEEIDLNGSKFGVLVGKPCNRMYVLEPAQYEFDHWTFSNGSVQMMDKVIGQKEYCFAQSKNESSFETNVLLCLNQNPDLRLTLYPIGMLFSLPFLIITFFVYGFIPELRNLHGKSLMCYVFGLALLYISLSVVQLDENNFEGESTGCILSGYTIYISVFLCFFWLNVMCLDIWSTFKGIRGRSGDRKRFLFYCFYAFGTPLLMTFIIFLVDKFVPDEYNNLKPLIGMKRCWIQPQRASEAIYIYTPISIIIMVNITLYSITAYKIFKVQRETSAIRNGESQKHSKMDADKDRFFLYLRLFIVMGVTWSMEAISWIFPDSKFLFYVSDFLNCLQGFIIFILFVWKPKVKQLIIRRYRSIRKLPPLTSQTHSAGSMRTETSRISSGVSSIKCQEKPMLDD